MKSIEKLEYYPVQIQINGKTIFCLWYALENEDRLISSKDKLTVFSSMDEVIRFCVNRELKLNLEHETAFYDLDIPFEENESKELLSFWNIFTDIANSINISFRGDVQGGIRDDIYDKLCNEVIWKVVKAQFSKEEKELLRELWNEGKEMISKEIRE